MFVVRVVLKMSTKVQLLKTVLLPDNVGNKGLPMDVLTLTYTVLDF